ncbi:TatD family hydrolase [Entomospira entomophila]|uniref:TatD family hydrolase n=1 Tax=Entomospira entomophila TaxID=2719988 RepID=A0A968GAF9_9SPIO|nr:TatD family hydrolase [Entomospira entomophilus]NIZ40058.1 TatD family hydrolase [Entomospira entomophilus]WDI35619.1 TatD family hydrolase [Entomospira entomophilus]
MHEQSLRDMIDHHCHMMQTQSSTENAMQLLESAFQQGLFAIIDAGDATKTQQERLDFFAPYERAFMVIGQHPLDMERPFSYEEMIGLLSDPKVIGVGEVGLDFSRQDIDRRKQQTAFEVQLTLANQYDLPIMLHIRDAFDEAYQMVKRVGHPRLVIHCFTGDRDEAKRWLDLGAYLSFSGVITFKNAQEIQDGLTYTPLDRILCETDAPYLTPVPHRGKPNHPVHVAHVYDQVSKLKEVPIDNLVAQVKENFLSLYQLYHLD